MKDLVKLIKANPGAVFTVDNDCWWMHRARKKGESIESWQETGELANYEDVKVLGDGGYGSGCCYGGDILQALAKIVGVKVESV